LDVPGSVAGGVVVLLPRLLTLGIS
jgi:hypothetical protein